MKSIIDYLKGVRQQFIPEGITRIVSWLFKGSVSMLRILDKGLENHSGKLLLAIIAIACLCYAFLNMTPLMKGYEINTLDDRAKFGDSFGGLTALAGIISTIVIGGTLILQAKELKALTENLQSERLDRYMADEPVLLSSGNPFVHLKTEESLTIDIMFRNHQALMIDGRISPSRSDRIEIKEAKIKKLRRGKEWGFQVVLAGSHPKTPDFEATITYTSVKGDQRGQLLSITELGTNISVSKRLQYRS